MAEEAQENDTPKSVVKEEAATHDIESQIQSAMRSRVSYFKEQADSLTLEKVRRLLEKDLGLEIYALDKHKRYIKQSLEKYLDGSHDTHASKNSVETGGERVMKGEAAESLEEHRSKKDVKEPCSEDEEETKDSPVMGLLIGHKQAKLNAEEIKNNDSKGVPSEITIKKAIKKRASYFKANSHKVTMTEVRRLLEDDLKIDEHTLDPCKKLISQQVEEILSSSEVPKSAPVGKKKSDSKASKKVTSKESSDSADSESGENEGDEEKPKRKTIPKGKMQKSDGLKKRKRPMAETVTVKKQSKSARPAVEDDIDEDGGNVSEDGQSQSSGEKPVKKKEVSTPAYGKRVEHLKSVIKSCGMSVPPSVYKKVKQVPENKREAQLIKELEEILSKEGLSSNPSEKEIKEVKKKKERAKELEGIDTSNIVSSSRRRSTTSFVSPPKPKIEVESDSDDSEEEEEDDDDDDEVDEDNDNNEEDEDVEDNGDGSQSEEEVNEDDAEASD